MACTTQENAHREGAVGQKIGAKEELGQRKQKELWAASPVAVPGERKRHTSHWLFSFVRSERCLSRHEAPWESDGTSPDSIGSSASRFPWCFPHALDEAILNYFLPPSARLFLPVSTDSATWCLEETIAQQFCNSGFQQKKEGKSVALVFLLPCLFADAAKILQLVKY